MQITNRLAASVERVDSVLLDLNLTNESDVPSADVLKELHDDIEAAGLQLRLASVRPTVPDLLDRSGATGSIGAEHIYSRVLEGVVFHLAERNDQAETFRGLSVSELKRLQRIVNGMLVHAEHDKQAQLKVLVTQMSIAMDETAHS